MAEVGKLGWGFGDGGLGCFLGGFVEGEGVKVLGSG